MLDACVNGINMESDNMGGKKILIVYYSRTGRTKKVAEWLKTMFCCDIEEIVDSKVRNGMLVFISGGKDAILKNETSIQKTILNPEEYDIIIIGSPVWASHIVPAIRTYINENREKFKRVAFFCTQTKYAVKGSKIFGDMEFLCDKKPIGLLKVAANDFESKEIEKKLALFQAEIINSK